jgi:hypothetical protein
METYHAQFSPSKLPRIMLCPASGLIESPSDPAVSNIYADEGTKLHLVVNECLDSQSYTVPYMVIKKYQLTQPQVEAVEDCLAYSFNIMSMLEDDTAYELIDTKVTMDGFVNNTGCDELSEVSGTLDYAIVSPKTRTLYVIDWKFGAGIEVYADTPQLKAYGLGCLKNPIQAQQFDKVVLAIVQPRIVADDKIKLLETTTSDLLQWMKDELVPALSLVKSKHPVYNPVEKACRWCPAKATCAARRDAVKEIAKNVFALHGTLPNPEEDELARLLDKADMLRYYLSDLEEYAYIKIMKGGTFPGYKLVYGRSNREWANEQNAINWMAEIGMKEDQIYTKKMMSPAQAEKAIGRQWRNHPEFLNLITKADGKPTLVKLSDKRDALVFKTPTEVFADVLIE